MIMRIDNQDFIEINFVWIMLDMKLNDWFQIEYSYKCSLWVDKLRIFTQHLA